MTDYKKIWWILLFVKLLLAALIPLSADESYYWVWSQLPQLSYYDHPPMVAWFFKLGSYLPTELVRWPSLIFFHLAFLLWFQFLKDFLSSRQILWWFILCLLSPLTGLGSIVVTPDAPLFVFFSLSLLFFIRALKSKALFDYAAFGAFLGLGFLSKYIIVVAAFLFVLSLLAQRNWIHFKSKALFPVIFLGLFFSLPVIIWNWQNDFKSFQFQINHGLGAKTWSWTWTAEYILGISLIIFPLNFLRAVKCPAFPLKNLFQMLSFGGLLFFLLSSFRGSVELNWPSIFIPCLFALSVIGLKKNDLKLNFAYWGFIYTAIFTLAAMNIAPMLREKMNEPFKAKAWAHLPKDYQPLYASTYQLASLMWWSSRLPVYKLPGSSRYDFFDEIAVGPPDANTFYLLKEQANSLPDWFYSEKWKSEDVQKLDEKHLILKIYRQDIL